MSRTIKKVAVSRPSQKAPIRLPTPPASQPLPIETSPSQPSTLRAPRVRARPSPTSPRHISVAPAEILGNSPSGFNAQSAAEPSPNPRSKKKSRISNEIEEGLGRKSVAVTIPMRRMSASLDIGNVQKNMPRETHKSLGKGKGRASSSRTPSATLSQSTSSTRRVSGGSNSSSQSRSKTPAAPRTKVIPATAPARRRLSKAPSTSRKEPVKRRASTGMALTQTTPKNGKGRARKNRTTMTQEMFESKSVILDDPIHGSPGDDPLLLKGVPAEEMEWDGEDTRNGLISGLGLQMESRNVVEEPVSAHRAGPSTAPSPSTIAKTTQCAPPEQSPLLPTLYNRFENGEIDVGQYDDWGNDFGGGWSDDDSVAGEDTFLHVKERQYTGEPNLAVIGENVTESPFIPRKRSTELMQEERELSMNIMEKEGEGEANAEGHVTLEAEEGAWDEGLTVRQEAHADIEPGVSQLEEGQNRTDGEADVTIEAESDAWDNVPACQDDKVESSNQRAHVEPCNAVIEIRSSDLSSSPQVNATRLPSPKRLATPRQKSPVLTASLSPVSPFRHVQPTQLEKSPAVRNAEEQSARDESRQISVAGLSPAPTGRFSAASSPPAHLKQCSPIPNSPTYSRRSSLAPPPPVQLSYYVHPARSPSQPFSRAGSLRPLSILPTSPISKGSTQEAPELSEPEIEAVQHVSSLSPPGRSPRRSLSRKSFQSPALRHSISPHYTLDERSVTRSPLILIKHRGEGETAPPTEFEHNRTYCLIITPKRSLADSTSFTVDRSVSQEPTTAQNEDGEEKDDIIVRAERMVARLSMPLSPRTLPLLREETPALVIQAASPENSPASQPFITSAQISSSSVDAHRFTSLSPVPILVKPRISPLSSPEGIVAPQPQPTPALQMTPQDHEYTGTSPLVSPISDASLQHTPIPQFKLYPGETPLVDASYREPTLGFRRGTPHPKKELASPATDCSPFGPQTSAPQSRLSLQRGISADTHSDSSLQQKGSLLLPTSPQAGSPNQSHFQEFIPARRSPNLSPSITMKKNSQTSSSSSSPARVLNFPQSELKGIVNHIQASKIMDSPLEDVHLEPVAVVTQQKDVMGVEVLTKTSIIQETASAVHAQTLVEDNHVENEVGPDGLIECSTNSVVTGDVEPETPFGPTPESAHANQLAMTLDPGGILEESDSVGGSARLSDEHGDDEQNIGNDSGLTEMTDKTAEGDSAAWDISAASLNESVERSNELEGIEKTCERRKEDNEQDAGTVYLENNVPKSDMSEKDGEEDDQTMEETLSENEQYQASGQENDQEETNDEDEGGEPSEAQDKIIICVVSKEAVKVEPGLEDDAQERQQTVSEIPDQRHTPAIPPPLHSSEAAREPSMQSRRTPAPSRLISGSASNPCQKTHQRHTPTAPRPHKQVATKLSAPAPSTPYVPPSAPATPSDTLYPSLNNLDSPLSIGTSFITSTPLHQNSSNPTAISNERSVFGIAGENTPQCIPTLEKMFAKKTVGHSKLSQQVIPSSSPSRGDPNEMESVQVDEKAEDPAKEKDEHEPHKSDAECDTSGSSQDNEVSNSVQIKKPRRSLHEELAAVARDENEGDNSFKSVVEVSSLDPKAAARAAAILKLVGALRIHAIPLTDSQT